MKRIYVLLALAVLPVPGQVGSIALYYKFQFPPTSTLLESLKVETNALVTPTLRLEWKPLPSTGSEVSADLAVITFQGSCSGAFLQKSMQRDPRLGWTHVTDREILPFAVIDCDQIGAFIERRLKIASQTEREELLGRAIGRVLAHELDHILARSANHTDRVIDQPTYSVEDLTDDRVPVPAHILHSGNTVPTPLRGGSASAGKSIFSRNGCAACHGSEGQGTKRGPVLRAAGHFITAVMLATRLTRDEHRMADRAQSLKIPAPTLSESDLQDLVSFLNAAPQQ
jgi:cytochrome c551/c552